MKTDAVVKVGVREFRSHLPQYLVASSPVAITRHGETIGYYIPTKHNVEKSEVDELREAARQLEKLLLSKGLSEDDLLKEFRVLRAKKEQ